MKIDQRVENAAGAVWNMTLGCAFNADPPQVFEVMSAAELERLLLAAWEAIARPVLDLHRPCHEGDGDCPKCFPQGRNYRVCGTCRPGARYPCPTVRALGVGDDQSREEVR